MRPCVLLGLLVLAACGGDEKPAPAPQELMAFSSNRGGDFDIYVMRPDGSDLRLLTRDRPHGEVEADDYEPAWSHDGNLIAFTSTRDHAGDGAEAQDVYVVGADGRNIRRLTDNALAEFAPTWTNDGRVAFWRCRQATFACSLVATRPSAQGGEETLYRATRSVYGADISPDAARLLYTGHDPRTTAPPAVYAVTFGFEDEERLADRGGDASWSPDGRNVVFTSDRDRNGSCLFHDCTGWAPELYVVSLDGTGLRRLTRTEEQELHPEWSPDGRRIVFARIADDNDDYELYVVDASGGRPRRLTANDAFDWMPDWYGPPR